MTQSVDDIIQHYGILGMKWGRRRPINSDGLVVKSGGDKKPASSTPDKPKEPRRKEALKKSKKASSLTDDELVSYTKRLNLENTLDRLSKETKTSISPNLKNALSNNQIASLNKRLQLESNYKKEVNTATAKQRKIGQLVTNTIGEVGFNYAVSALEGNKGSFNDILSKSLKDATKTVANESLDSNLGKKVASKVIDEAYSKTKKKK